MKAPVRVICRHETALGIALAGVAPIEVATAAEAAAALARLGGVVLIEQPLYDLLPTTTRRQIRKAGLPIVMPFPGPAPLAAGIAPEEELLEVLRRAIGYRVRLR